MEPFLLEGWPSDLASCCLTQRPDRAAGRNAHLCRHADCHSDRECSVLCCSGPSLSLWICLVLWSQTYLDLWTWTDLVPWNQTYLFLWTWTGLVL